MNINFKERELIQRNRLNFEKMKKNLFSKKKLNDSLEKTSNNNLINKKVSLMNNVINCPYINNINKMRKALGKVLNPKQQLEKIRMLKMNATFDQRNFKKFKNQPCLFYKSFDPNVRNNFLLSIKNSPQKSNTNCKYENMENSDQNVAFSFRSSKFQNNIKLSFQDKPYHKNLHPQKCNKLLFLRNLNRIRFKGSL